MVFTGFWSQVVLVLNQDHSAPLTPQDAAGGHLPRRRWSRRMAGNEVLEVKSMLDLRLLDLDCPDRQAELRAEPQVRKLTGTTTNQTP